MRCNFNNGTTAVNVDLQLGGGVAIDGPELWILVGQNFVQAPGPPTVTAARARWRNIPRPAHGGIFLQLFWSAFDPMHNTWRYEAKITVTDQSGARLPGRDGHVNPARLPRDVGAIVPSWGHEQEPISIF